MQLGLLIKFLEKCDPNIVVPMGFSNPHSYRGYYQDLAFEPTENVTVKGMLESAKSALGTTYTGYKGGEYLMDENCEVWLAQYGMTGEGLGEILLKYMVGGYQYD